MMFATEQVPALILQILHHAAMAMLARQEMFAAEATASPARPQRVLLASPVIRKTACAEMTTISVVVMVTRAQRMITA